MRKIRVFFLLLITPFLVMGGHANPTENPLHAAVRRGEMNQVEALVRSGADVNLPDSSGDPPLSLAARGGHNEVVNFLLKSGANLPGAMEKRHQMQLQAAHFGMEILMNRLLRVSDPGKPRNANGGTLLHEAAGGGHPGIIGELIQRGMRIDARDRNGWTPLHYAAARGRNTAILLLLRSGAPLNARDTRGRSAFNLASDQSRRRTAGLLLRKGADPGPADFPQLKNPWLGQKPPGETPLIFAPGIVSGHYALSCAPSFSPDGETVAWHSLAPGGGVLLFSTRINGLWTAPVPLFAEERLREARAPVFSLDGRLLFLTPTADPRKYILNQVNPIERGWSQPSPLPGSPPDLPAHLGFSLDQSGNLFFATGKGIFQSDLHRGEYAAARRLNIPDMGENAISPFISPAGEYLLFAASSPGKSNLDLFVTFRKTSGQWTPAKALAPPVNSPGMEISPAVSPDGKYLFFIRWHHRVHGAYWVSTRAIQRLAPKDFIHD